MATLQVGVALPVESVGVVWLQCGVPDSETAAQPRGSSVLIVSRGLSETSRCESGPVRD